MDLALAGRRAIVTGGSRGIGRAIAADAFLASGRAGYITGASVDVAGGMGKYL
jgi:short-subunit dehydrogenase involved in D-alanine esterification of teichoic acids